MRSWAQAVTALILTLVILASGGIALAQESIPLTPVADPDAITACTVEPANLDRVAEIAGSALNDPNATLEIEPPVTGGEIVTGRDADAVIALMDQMIACVNAVDPARFLALFSDDFIQRAAYDIAGLLEGAESAAQPENDEPADGAGDVEESFGDPTIIVGAGDVHAQPDGRLAYTVSIGTMAEVNSDNIPAPQSLIQIIAVEQRGDWKIDDLREESLDDPGEPDCVADGVDGCATPDEANHVEGDGYTGWLMTESAAEEAATWLLGFDADTATPFQPSATEVAEAEAALPAFVADHANATDRIIDELETGLYERQYLGYVTPDGPILVINAYCDEPFSDPAQTVNIVEDGGDCYWQATYDLTAGEFTDFSVNGES